MNFGTNDQLEGRVHTNGNMALAVRMPEFSGSVTITDEAVENGGGIGSWGACDEGVFEQNIGGETVNILDTIAAINFPPENSAQLVRANADYVFSADDMLFRTGKKDTMVMTEINFTENGFWASQWWYNIPPIGGPPNEFDFRWDAINGALNVAVSGVHFGPDNIFTPGIGYEGTFLILSALDISGTNIRSTIISSISSGDVLRISNAGGSKTVAFAANNDPIPIGEDRVMIQINSESITFASTTGRDFLMVKISR